MSIIRLKALEAAQTRVTLPSSSSNKNSEHYGSSVFGYKAMRQYLSKEANEAIQQAILNGRTINRDIADQIASGMKQWAMSKGVSHYSHWFQPLTGATAEKHDAFFEPSENGSAIDKFTASSLVQQEPDASSFPNGGLRNTFEARGYTAWDPSSPAFVCGNTLCIPTIFVSYNGDALDYKAPLLKSLNCIDKAATAVCKYFDENVVKVSGSLGIEQEYFLIDEAFYYARPDLMMTGRTLVGYSSAKGQQLDDHYFGSIPERVLNYMADLELESIKLGIPLKTRHNEVAPCQYECAPMFEEINLAVDHNSLLMDLMDKVAKKHKFKVLLHEKPYAGVNGSGKHNNWSLITNTGINLLSPSDSPENNLQFITFLVNTIKAVYEHADLLRASIASAGNEYRLGANEAPPAIISVFIGTQLTHVLNDLKNETSNKANDLKNILVHKIPEILVDNTDRNRTSPFAFTGNKFEFRAVGSSANSASPMIVLNSIVADQLISFKKEVDEMISTGIEKNEAIRKTIKRYIIESEAVLFEGNGYGDEWIEEADRRGLTNVKNAPDALQAYVSDKTKKLFSNTEIFTERELIARHEILLESFVKRVQIESRVLGDLANTFIIPTAISYQAKLISTYEKMKSLDIETTSSTVILNMIKEIDSYISLIKDGVFKMVNERKVANKMEDIEEMAKHYSEKVKAYFEVIRYNSDKLERIVEDEIWPLPKYREMLFMK